MAKKSSCEYCMYYQYNEDYEYYECAINLDEDEMMRFLSDSHRSCPHFKYGDDYSVVKKQM
nr:DUF6472 family protein [uncultured Clostridium sp.]